jgi:hypothetical protein
MLADEDDHEEEDDFSCSPGSQELAPHCERESWLSPCEVVFVSCQFDGRCSASPLGKGRGLR